MAQPSLGKLSWIFFRIGNSTFGGGDPTIAALQRELVAREDWLSQEDYGLAFSLARITPGTNVIAFCAGVGSRILGWPGAVAGALGETFASAVIAVVMTQGYESWRSNAWVLAGVAGTIAAVVGMMWASGALLVKSHFKNVDDALRAIVIAGAAFLAFAKYGVNPLWIIGAAALAGLVWPEPKLRSPSGERR